MNITLKVYALCVLVLFLKMLTISCYQGYVRFSRRAFSNPEDARFVQLEAIAQELEPVRRAARAWANDLENIPLFFVLGGLCVALDTATVPTAGLFYLFTAARVLHTLMYLRGLQPWRTAAYGAGVVCLLGLAGVIGLKIAVS